MSIQSEINRIAGAKSDIADAIEDMGGTLSPGASIDDLAAGVRTIPQGSSDYDDLTNKPQINSVTLTGNKSLSDIGAYAKPAGGIPDSDIASAAVWNAKGTYTKPSGGIPDSDIASAATWNAKGTYSKPSGGIPDSDIASAAAWNAKANAPVALSLTLASGSWTSATPATQTVTATGVTANSSIIIGLAGTATSAQFDEAAAAKLVCTAQGTDSITVTAYGTTPTGNIPISVVILG